MLSLPLLAQQPERARTEALARRATERLQALQREADLLASEEQTLIGDLRKLEIERQIKAEQYKQVDALLQGVAAELARTSDRMRQLEQRDLAERPGLRARLIEIYKLGQGRYLRLLLSTSDLRTVGQASRTVAALAELDTRHRELETLRGDVQRAQTAADRAAQARSDLIRDIDRRRDLNAQLASELQAAQQKLQAALKDLASGSSAAVQESPTLLPLRPFRGDLPWPVVGAVQRRFGRPAGPAGAASNGIEIAATEGAAAQAVHDGVVAFADRFGGFGNLVIVDHGAQAFSLYGNLLEIAIKKGAHLERGQTIGTVGPSPAGAAELYFELRVDGQPVDPLQWLKKR